MPLKFHCVCGQALIVSRRLVGHGVRCPRCETKVKVPAPRGSVANSLAAETPPSTKTASRSLSAPHRLRALTGIPSRSDATVIRASTRLADSPSPGPTIPANSKRIPSHPSQPSARLADSPDQQAEEVSGDGMAGDIVHGYEPHPEEVSAAHWVALGLVVVALCGLAAPIGDIVSHFRVAGSPGIAAWAYLAIWLAFLKIAYAAYVAQLPDWSTVWVTTWLTLVLSVAYAMLFGLTTLARPDSWVAQSLDLSDHLAGGRAAGWCFIMLCLTSSISYLSGRLSFRWRQAYADTW